MARKPVSKTISRLNEDIRRELVDIISIMRDPRLKQGLLTVTRVETTSDLSQAKVYVSIMGSEEEASGAIGALRHAKGHVRSEISSRMHIRKAPEIVFIADDSAAYAAHINELLSKL